MIFMDRRALFYLLKIIIFRGICIKILLIYTIRNIPLGNICKVSKGAHGAIVE